MQVNYRYTYFSLPIENCYALSDMTSNWIQVTGNFVLLNVM